MDIALVNHDCLSFPVSLSLALSIPDLRLRDKLAPLLKRVVLLFVHVRQLLPAHEQFGARRHVLACLGTDEGFRERGHADRVVGDEQWGRGGEWLDVLRREAVEELGEGHGGGVDISFGSDVVLFEKGDEVFERGGGGEVWEGAAEGGVKGWEELGLLERGGVDGQVDGLEGSEFGGDEGLTVLGGAADEGLGEGDEILEVGVGVVEFADGKFWVMSLVNTFVSEGWAKLKDTLDAADNQSFEPELRGNPQGNVPGDGVGGHDEGAGSSTAGISSQNRRLELEEVPLVEEVAEVLDEIGPQPQNVGRLLVHEHIEMAMRGPRFLVYQLRGQRDEARGQQLGQMRCLNGELAGRCACCLASNSWWEVSKRE